MLRGHRLRFEFKPDSATLSSIDQLLVDAFIDRAHRIGSTQLAATAEVFTEEHDYQGGPRSIGLRQSSK
jgi:hypothetical protein